MSSLGDMEIRLLGDDSDLMRTLSNAQKNVNNFGSSLKNMFEVAGGIAIAKGFEALADGIKNVISLGWEFDKTMETNKIAFDTIIGSQEKSNKLMENLVAMAAQTPFELPDLTKASKKLLAFGFAAEAIPYTLKQIGDASAGVGLGADGINRITIALGLIIAIIWPRINWVKTVKSKSLKLKIIPC